MTDVYNHRRQLLAAITCAIAAPHAFAQQARNIEVWKDPNCGCCKDWIVHLEAQQFRVKIYDVGNTSARNRLGMPSKLGSCHTAKVQGYVIEGHVPATQIHRLLKERPVALGLAVPGMPIGSPGMDAPSYGGRRESYQVLLVQKEGSTTVFSNES